MPYGDGLSGEFRDAFRFGEGGCDGGGRRVGVKEYTPLIAGNIKGLGSVIKYGFAVGDTIEHEEPVLGKDIQDIVGLSPMLGEF